MKSCGTEGSHIVNSKKIKPLIRLILVNSRVVQPLLRLTDNSRNYIYGRLMINKFLEKSILKS